MAISSKLKRKSLLNFGINKPYIFIFIQQHMYNRKISLDGMLCKVWHIQWCVDFAYFSPSFSILLHTIKPPNSLSTWIQNAIPISIKSITNIVQPCTHTTYLLAYRSKLPFWTLKKRTHNGIRMLKFFFWWK